MAATDGTARRYLALLARAKDQAGTPEGDTCASMAAAMLAACPTLADIDGAMPTTWQEYRYADPWQRDLLVRIAEYLSLVPKGYVKSRKKVILIEADAPTHAAIGQTFAVLSKRMQTVLSYAFAGFQAGALPIKRVPREDAGDDRDEPDPDLMELAMAAKAFGRDSQPRKALRS
jgi:hypothetical protein